MKEAMVTGEFWVYEEVLFTMVCFADRRNDVYNEDEVEID
jgi:hypothetical protein